MWALVIAVACELPNRLDLPLNRHFASSVWRVVRDEDVAISLRTVQRMLARHHLKPWRYASWMHPRDPNFVDKTRTILDLYAGFWKGQRVNGHAVLLVGGRLRSWSADTESPGGRTADPRGDQACWSAASFFTPVVGAVVSVVNPVGLSKGCGQAGGHQVVS